jgi:hypothetical protein
MDGNVIRRMLKRAPFHPFILETSSGYRCKVWHPECALVFDGVIVVFDRDGVPDIIDCDHVVRAQESRPRHRKTT